MRSYNDSVQGQSRAVLCRVNNWGENVLLVLFMLSFEQ